MFQTIPAIMDILDSLGLSGWADRDKKKKKKEEELHTLQEKRHGYTWMCLCQEGCFYTLQWTEIWK